jgi:hypothetical protein
MTGLLLRCIVFVFLGSIPISSAEIYPYQVENVFIVDNFEDKNVYRHPKWWIFGDIDVFIKENKMLDINGIEKFSMVIKGKRRIPKMVGGVGTFLGVDLTPHNAIKFMIYGQGRHSGILMIELFDDDSNDFEVTPHPFDASQIIHDDKFTYHFPITWEGWKVVIIQLDSFKDANPLFGDNVFNPYQTNTSGGLLQLQLLLFASDQKKNPRLSIDTIKFFNTENIKDETLDNQYYISEDDLSKWKIIILIFKRNFNRCHLYHIPALLIRMDYVFRNLYQIAPLSLYRIKSLPNF